MISRLFAGVSILACAGLLAGVERLTAQQPQDIANARFEVASVKPNKSGENGMRIGMSPNGRFQATNVTVQSLIQNAYNVRPFQVSGGPGWLTSDRFDIVATVGHEIKPTAAGPPPELIQMVKNLLADRFQLAVHTETREAPVYNLEIARDGRLGPNFKGSNVDCGALMARGGPPPAVPPGELSPCSIRVTSGTNGSTRMIVRTGTMPQLVRQLAGLVERYVVDKTGLPGAYDVDLEWSQDQTVDASKPSIFAHLQEQLGLRLEAARGPVEMLVIDRAQPPEPD